ncbi:unnamed protein product, partial [Adineta ricciae]
QTIQITKSTSLESLDRKSVDETIILTSTKLTEEKSKDSIYKAGRRALLPSTDLSNRTENSENNTDVKTSDKTQKNTVPHPSNQILFDSHSSLPKEGNNPEKSSQLDTNFDNDSFDVFDT